MNRTLPVYGFFLTGVGLSIVISTSYIARVLIFGLA